MEDLAHLLIDVMRPGHDGASVGSGWSVVDPFSFKQDGLTASEVDIGRGEIGDALMVSQVIGQTTGTSVMRGFADDPNIAPYIDDIYAYLQARSDGVLGRGRPARIGQ